MARARARSVAAPAVMERARAGIRGSSLGSSRLRARDSELKHGGFEDRRAHLRRLFEQAVDAIGEALGDALGEAVTAGFRAFELLVIHADDLRSAGHEERLGAIDIEADLVGDVAAGRALLGVLRSPRRS